jgi:epimerase transport system membrane fusion protein
MTTSKKSTQKHTEMTVNTDDRPVRWLGYFILLSTLGIFGSWSYYAPIASSSIAVGKVTVEDHRQTVQHFEGGIIKTLWVKEGDKVSLGDLLITLDNTQFEAQVKVLQGQFIVRTASNLRLNAERRGQSQIDFSEILTLNDLRVQEAINDQRYLFRARQKSYNGEIDLLAQKIQQIDSKIKGLEIQKDSKQQLTRSFDSEIAELEILLEEGFTEKPRLMELKRSHTRVYGEIAGLNTEVITSQMSQGEAKLQILQTTKKYQADIAKQLEQINAELFDITERLYAERARVKRTKIKAPVGGIIIGLEVNTQGGVIRAGEPILDIVPEDADLVIEAKVKRMDIDKVFINSEAKIRFSAFNSKTTPTMEAVVIKLSPDSVTDPKTGDEYYEATLELTEEGLEKLDGLVLISGMPAEVLINTGERTVFEYLVKPATSMIANAFTEE